MYTIHDCASGLPYEIDDGVEVISTPGHTCQDISVIARNSDGVAAIVGDLFESEADRDDENLWRSASAHPELQETNRNRILAIADLIVPGHGEAFTVR